MLLLTLSVSVLAGGTAAGLKPPTPEYSPPPRETSPFTPRDAFCSTQGNTFDGVARNDTRLMDKIPVVMLVPPPDPSQAANFPGLKLGDPVDEAETFADLVNKCGGIGGRKLEFHVLAESGNPLVDCLTATTRIHALIVVSWTASPAASCVANDEHTIMVTESDVSNDMLAAAHGNLVATGTTEGALQARILDLIQSGRLDGKRIAIVAGTSPTDLAFTRTATALLNTNKMALVPMAEANALLVPTIDPATLPTPSVAPGGSTTTGKSQTPLDVYGFADASDQSIDLLRQLGATTAPESTTTTGLFAYTPIEDQQARLGQSAGQFATMCNREYAANHGSTVKAADLPQPSPPAASSSPYLQVAKVCLAMRIVSRALFNAGIDLTQSSAIKALHKLSYIENVLPDAVKKPRPNQVFNEPVTRIEQVVVLSQAEYPCRHPSLPKNPVDYRACWAPVAGWDDGGRAVNAPLLSLPG